METPDYPPNSFSSKQPPEPNQNPQEKSIERVTSSEPIRRKKSLGRKFREVFFAGNLRSTAQWVLGGVILPAAQDLFIDAVNEASNKFVRGDSYRRRRDSRYSGDRGYIDYGRRFSYPDPRDVREQPRTLSPRARARHDFDEIMLESRPEAEEVISQMFEIVSRYDTATVADLYELVGIRPSHVDHKWGWSDMRGAGVSRTRDGRYLLELPDVQPMAM
jgi:hypothetical protein